MARGEAAVSIWENGGAREAAPRVCIVGTRPAAVGSIYPRQDTEFATGVEPQRIQGSLKRIYRSGDFSKISRRYPERFVSETWPTASVALPQNRNRAGRRLP